MRSALHPTACWFLSRYSLDERPIRPSGTQDGLRTQRSATAQLAGRSMPGRIETCVSCRQSGDRCRNARQVTDMRSRCVRPATASSRDLGRGRHQVGRRDWAWRDDCSALRWWVAKSNPPGLLSIALPQAAVGLAWRRAARSGRTTLRVSRPRCDGGIHCVFPPYDASVLRAMLATGSLIGSDHHDRKREMHYRLGAGSWSNIADG
jgi:hypothetical protein